jgi:hypothetical protein
MNELEIKKLPNNCVTLFTNREFFGYGRGILLTPEAQTELIDWFQKNIPEERHL